MMPMSAMKSNRKVYVWLALALFLWKYYPHSKGRSANNILQDIPVTTPQFQGHISTHQVMEALGRAKVYHSPSTRSFNMDNQFVIGIISDGTDIDNLRETVISLCTKNQQRSQSYVIVVQFYTSSYGPLRTIAREFYRSMSRYVYNGQLVIIVTWPGVKDIVLKTAGKLEFHQFERIHDGLSLAQLMFYSRQFGDYFIYLSDKTFIEKDYLHLVDKFLHTLEADVWLQLRLGGVGLFGSMFRSTDLTHISQRILTKCHQQSPNAIMKDIIDMIYPKCERISGAHCIQELGLATIPLVPPVFRTNISCDYTASSLLYGKESLCWDPNHPLTHEPRPWEDVPILVNPEATLYTTIRAIKPHTLDAAYNLHDYFLAEAPVAGDTIIVNFTTPTAIEEFFLRSKHSGHPGARFDTNTYVDVYPLYPDKVRLERRGHHFQCKRMSDGYIAVGRFNDRGIAEGPLGDANFGKIRSLRIRVTKNHKTRAVLREMIFKQQVVPSDVRACCENYWPDPFPNGIRGADKYDKVE